MLGEVPPFSGSDPIQRFRWPNKITHGDYAPFRTEVESVFAVGVVDIVKFPVLEGSCDREEKLALHRHDRDRHVKNFVVRLGFIDSR